MAAPTYQNPRATTALTLSEHEARLINELRGDAPSFVKAIKVLTSPELFDITTIEWARDIMDIILDTVEEIDVEINVHRLSDPVES